MALPYLTDVATYCRTVVEPRIKDNILKSNAVFFRLAKSQHDWPGGTYFETPIKVSKNTNAQAYQNGATLKIAHVDQTTKMQFPRSMYNVAITLYGSEIDANTGKGRVLNLVADKSDMAINDLKDAMGTDLFSSTGGALGDTKLEGLLNVCGDSLVKWGNVVTSDFSSFLPNGGTGYDGKTTTLTQTVFNKAFYAASIDNNTKPTLVVTTADLFGAIESTWLQGKAQYLDPELAEAGFAQIRLKGMTTVWDSHCPSASIFLLNEKALWLGVSPDKDFKFFDFVEKIDADYSVAHIRWYGNLIGNHRASQALFSAITTVS